MNNIDLRARWDKCREQDLCFVSLRALPKEPGPTDFPKSGLSTPFHAELGHTVIIYTEYVKS